MFCEVVSLVIFDRQHINILFINKSDELIRGIPELFCHEMCVL